MKIGILTFHRAHNYGAMLQAYALRKVLVDKGHNVEFVSYRQPKIENAYKSFQWTYNKSNGIVDNTKNLLSALITLPRRVKRRKVFIRFANKYLPESRKYSKEELLSQEFSYDALFFGSDQIWTTRFMGSFDDVFWGEIQLKHGRKIAYAPSMELKSVAESEKAYIRKHIQNFDSVSARETHMSKLLENVTGQFVPTVVDPTLLCNKEDFIPLIAFSKHVPSEPYVLVYQVGRHDIVMDIAKKIAMQLHCQIVEIGSQVLLRDDSFYKDNYGPADFVSLIANATFVVSCSFHGTAFSVNFQKPFYSVLIPGIDSRVVSFLKQIGLLECGIRSEDEVDVKSTINIDYEKVNMSLERLRQISMQYIEQSLI